MGVLRFVEPHTPVDMSIELTTSVTVLRLFRDALASLGADWEQILGLCDISTIHRPVLSRSINGTPLRSRLVAPTSTSSPTIAANKV